MFEIRIICDPADKDRVSEALAAAFTTGPARQHLTRDGQRTRLYLTADHRCEAEPWLAPEEAYALAPDIVREIGWTLQTARAVAAGTYTSREFWLRKAAVLDRIALQDESEGISTAAANAARKLMDFDEEPVRCDPRAYVRQQYATWSKQQQRTQLVAAGRCPNCQWLERDCNCADHPGA
ncbi:hypothetical protein [Streptomyces sp. NPDC096324]|uniref:hypothetical protein n=1 Tax=Streptomyces sp. NPDC096324 TaxID=3366085 RepID=UPI0037F2281E